MKKLYTLLLLSALWSGLTLQAQNFGPFLGENYDVQVEENVVYGANATILPILFQQFTEAVRRPLAMDVYMPVGDNNDARPLILVLHTGNFLPFPDNNGTGGTFRDSSVVEVCTRLAKRGYVAAALDYRLGWNPIDPNQDFRKFFLINAAYRGIQDTRTAVRYFRLTEKDAGNPYGIDPNKIGVWGIGTGGYITAGVNSLDEYNEILVEKFLINLGGPAPVPMVIEAVNGDINGTSVGIVPPGYPVLPEGDTLCYANHVTYADGTPIPSDVNVTINNGGAIGELSWIDENSLPWISFHVPNDRFAPYTSGVLTVPGTGDPSDPSDDFAVVDVDGSYNIQAELAQHGINDIFNDISLGDFEDYSTQANERNDGLNGLFPMPNDADSSSPWDFYAEDHPNVPPNPPTNTPLAKMYWDTIFAYAMPRTCVALNLGCEFTGTDDVIETPLQFSISPNPAQTEVLFSSTDNITPILGIELYSINGQLLYEEQNINTYTYQLNRNNLPHGMYIAKVRIEDGVFSEKIIFE